MSRLSQTASRRARLILPMVLFVLIVGSAPSSAHSFTASLTQPSRPPGAVWRFSTNGLHYEPVVVAGVVYLAAGGEIIALDAETGGERWRFADDSGQYPMVPAAAPAVGDGIVVVLSALIESTVIAIDAATGEMQWRTPFPGVFAFADGIKPLLVGGNVVFMDIDGTVHALAPETGRERWRADEGKAAGALGIAATDNLVVISHASGLIALSAGTGREAWRTASADRAPVVVGDLIVAATGGVNPDETGFVVAVSAAGGEERWRFPIPQGLFRSLSAAGDKVYAVSGGASTVLYAISTDGVERWHVAIDAAWNLAPVIDEDVIYCVMHSSPLTSVEANGNGIIAVSAATGEELWRLLLPASQFEQPVVADSNLFVAHQPEAGDGFLIAFDI